MDISVGFLSLSLSLETLMFREIIFMVREQDLSKALREPQVERKNPF